MSKMRSGGGRSTAARLGTSLSPPPPQPPPQTSPPPLDDANEEPNIERIVDTRFSSDDGALELLCNVRGRETPEWRRRDECALADETIEAFARAREPPSLQPAAADEQLEAIGVEAAAAEQNAAAASDEQVGASFLSFCAARRARVFSRPPLKSAKNAA